jgi:hypothetical protein
MYEEIDEDDLLGWGKTYFAIENFILTTALPNPDYFEQIARDHLRESGFSVKQFKRRIPRDNAYHWGPQIGCIYVFLPKILPPSVRRSVEVVANTWPSCSNDDEVRIWEYEWKGARVLMVRARHNDDEDTGEHMDVEPKEVKHVVSQLEQKFGVWGAVVRSPEQVLYEDPQLFSLFWERVE